jgi:hypothetical protein
MKHLNILGEHIGEATTNTGDVSRRLAMTGQSIVEPLGVSVAGSIF